LKLNGIECRGLTLTPNNEEVEVALWRELAATRGADRVDAGVFADELRYVRGKRLSKTFTEKIKAPVALTATLLDRGKRRI
jgi:hypothetical protein